MPSLTTSDFAVTRYSIPSLAATYPFVDSVAGAMSLAPSLVRTPRYSKVPSANVQMAMRESAVLPNSTAVAGFSQRAVEFR